MKPTATAPKPNGAPGAPRRYHSRRDRGVRARAPAAGGGRGWANPNEKAPKRSHTAASFLEFDDLVAGYFHLSLSAQVKVMEPLGEALPNQEIFRRVARAMGYTEPELYESDATVLATVLRKAGVVEDFATLAAQGTVPVSPEPLMQFADLHFPTSSGHIEIASARAEADGHPRVPLPLADPRPSGGRLRLLSPASPWLLSNSFANVAKIAARIGPATIALHPTDAAERDLAEGDEALVANETGSLPLRVILSEALPRGVALSHKGRWPKREAARANVNVLNPGRKSDMGENTCVHSIEVRVTPLAASKGVPRLGMPT